MQVKILLCILFVIAALAEGKTIVKRTTGENSSAEEVSFDSLEKKNEKRDVPKEDCTPGDQIIQKVDCDAKGVHIQLVPGDGYSGSVFVDGHDSESGCTKEFQSKQNTNFTLKYNTCGIGGISSNNKIQEGKDLPISLTVKATLDGVPIVYTQHKVQCSVPDLDSEAKASYQVQNSPKKSDKLVEAMSVKPSHKFTVVPVNNNGEVPHGGDEMDAVIEISPKGWGGRAVNCHYKNAGPGSKDIQLTDSHGCAVNPKIFRQFSWDESTNQLKARFLANSDGNNDIECQVEYCHGPCTMDCMQGDAPNKPMGCPA